jgi:hypothetical protein
MAGETPLVSPAALHTAPESKKITNELSQWSGMPTQTSLDTLDAWG